MSDQSNQFHAHLDECDQCRNHPFKLCPVGYAVAEQQVAKGYEATEERRFNGS